MHVNTIVRNKLIVLVLLILTSTVLLIFANRLWPLDDPYEIKPLSTMVKSREGELLRAFTDKDAIWRYPVKLEDVSKDYIDALLNYEDKYFYVHPGVNPIALFRAFVQYIVHGKIISGGSTLSMQVSRLLYPHQRSITGKIKQILRTLQLEWYYSKNEILTIYLNIAPFGGTFEGVATASHQYFRKQAKDLTPAEAALLAVLPQSPSKFRPDRYPGSAYKARKKVLNRLAHTNVWSKEKISQASNEPIAAFPAHHPMNAPLYSLKMSNTLHNTLHKRKEITTTIDLDLQQQLQAIVSDYTQLLPKNVTSAVLLREIKSGETLAYVGTGQFANKARFGYLDMIQAQRSPGSTLKPFLYALALDEGLIHANSLLNDAPITQGSYRPGNFNGKFSGPVSASTALQESLNVPVIQLLNQYSAPRFNDKLRGIGLPIKQNIDGTANISVVLGGQSINMTSLSDAYLSLAQSANGLKANKALISNSAAWLTADILSQKTFDKKWQTKSLKNNRQNKQIAWKTGTSYGYRDSWTIGFDQKYLLSVWVGRPDGSALPGFSGLKSAAPLFFKIFSQLPTPSSQFDKPKNITQQTICWPLGKSKKQTNKSHCHIAHKTWIIEGNIPGTFPTTNNSDRNPLPILVEDKTGLRGNKDCLVGATNQQTLALWPPSIEPWITKKWQLAQQLPQLKPSCQETIKLAQELPIYGVDNQSTIMLQQQADLSLTFKTNSSNQRYFWYVNGLFKTTVAGEKLTLKITDLGRYEISLVDSSGRSGHLTFTVI